MALAMDDSMTGNNDELLGSPVTRWAQLPGDILAAIFAHLSQSDKGSARLACRAWAEQIRQDVTHVDKERDLTSRDEAAFFATRLPSLQSLSLVHTESLYRLQGITRLTSLTINSPAYVPDLQPLSDLPLLRKLTLSGVEMGRTPCFDQLTQVRELACMNCQPGSMHADAEMMLRRVLAMRLHRLAFLHTLISRDLAPLAACLAAPGLHTLCLGAQFVRSFENLRQLASLKALALTRADRLDLAPLVALSGLEALSLAGLQGFASEGMQSEAVDSSKPYVHLLGRLRCLRVLDVRHSCAVDWPIILRLPALRLLATHAEFPLPEGSHWKLARKLDFVSQWEASNLPAGPAKRTRLRNSVLINTKRSGQQSAADEADEAYMRIFDDFWLAQVTYTVFETHENMDDDEFLEFDLGDNWEDAFFDDDAAYGYMEDAFNYMDDEMLDEMHSMPDLDFDADNDMQVVAAEL